MSRASELAAKMNAKVEQAKDQDYQKRITLDLRHLMRKTKGGFTLQCIQEFIDVVKPDALFDMSVLPYYTKLKDRAPVKSKRDCLMAIISHTIRTYWQYCKKEVTQVKLLDEIKKLETIIAAYPKVIVKGEAKGGFWLEINNES